MKQNELILDAPSDIGKIQQEFENHLRYAPWHHMNAQERHAFQALCMLIQDQIIPNWVDTMELHRANKAKRIYYFSTEYLPGRLLSNNMINLGMLGQCRKVLGSYSGFVPPLTWEKVCNCEEDPALGHGGLGRLASCFLDSLATHDIPSIAYGIRYRYGIFSQKIENGAQVIRPDDWIKDHSMWLVIQTGQKVSVGFGGDVRLQEKAGRHEYVWKPSHHVLGMPYNLFITGYNTKTVNTLMLWEAQAIEDFAFWNSQQCNYTQAVIQQIEAEKLTRVLYPSDHYHAGQELRFQQQYFFVACSLRDIVHRFDEEYSQDERHKRVPTWSNYPLFPEKVAIQMNDTHSALAIPELMRILVDEKRLDWGKAWEITKKTFAYTNHTLMPEALEKWPVSFFEKFLPRHLQIVYEINRRWLQEIARVFPNDNDRLRRLSLVEEGSEKKIRMAYLATLGSHMVNGVSEMHSALLQQTVLRDFYEIGPQNFTNVTNGVSQRRWLLVANPRLSEAITKQIGPAWTTDLHQIQALQPYADDPSFRQRIREIKARNKEDLVHFIEREVHKKVNPSALFDVQIKRIHEYKRQLLNLLHIASLYARIQENEDYDMVPRVFIFAGKASPSYVRARLIIRMIHAVMDAIQRDEKASKKIQIVFLPNYRVSLAEKIIPAADLSEQISTAGTEASGTSLFKFAMNGALTICTLDGANIEMHNAVGADNIFTFGHTQKEIQALRETKSYVPSHFCKGNSLFQKTIDALQSIFFKTQNNSLFDDVLRALFEEGDKYFLMLDFDSYIQAQEQVDALYRNEEEWSRKAILNIARIGHFSSDRSIQEYMQKIWS